ncbi:hypothetical protein GCM10008941_16910 [Rhizomicrobium palustre]
MEPKNSRHAEVRAAEYVCGSAVSGSGEPRSTHIKNGAVLLRDGAGVSAKIKGARD